jgi:SPX domain protein involved in polyphosphate accumulation
MKPKSTLFTSRFEIKYQLSKEMIPEVSKAIRRYAVTDPFVPPNQSYYTVKTIYMDTPDLKYYYEKLDGLKVRKKLRIRAYGHEHTSAFLEIKRRYTDIVVKERVKYSYEHLRSLLEDNGSHLSGDYTHQSDKVSRVAAKFLFYILKNRLSPTLLVIYDREAYFHQLAPYQRATIDTDIQYYLYPNIDDLFHGTGVVFLRQPAGILELKFNDFMPKWMRRLESEFDLRQESFSKYSFGIEACQNDLHKEVSSCPRTYWRLCS